jgi:hypothetical protein
MPDKDDVTLEGKVKHLTPKAMLVTLTAPKVSEIWIPLSQLKDTDCLAKGDEGYFVVPHWLAEKNELIDDEDDE